MKNLLFEKIYTNFKIDWNIDNLLNKFTEEIIDPINSKKMNHAYGKADGTPHWQLFNHANISFGRNILQNFPNELTHVLEKLKEVQEELSAIKNPSELLQLFINHNLDVNRINLTKINPNQDVYPHCDVTKTTSRDVALNIGLKNSSNGITYISDDSDIENFWPNKKYKSYIMEDGDIYLLRTRNAHAVKMNPKKNSSEPRYAITYTLVGTGYVSSGTEKNPLIVHKIT